jgi:hypothetical protein
VKTAPELVLQSLVDHLAEVQQAMGEAVQAVVEQQWNDELIAARPGGWLREYVLLSEGYQQERLLGVAPAR